MKSAFLLMAIYAAASAYPSSAKGTKEFAGARVGIEAGWGRVGGSRIASDGFIYGASAGYDLPIGKVRLAPEIEITGSTQKTCRQLTAGAPAQRSCERSGRDLYAGGRLGYVASPKILLYAKLGYTNARFSDRTETSIAALPDVRFNRGGVRVGGGIEYAVASNLYVSGEYRYSHYGHEVSLNRDRQGIRQNQLLAGVGYRF